MAKGDGKALETLLGQSVDRWGFSHNSNSATPLCDHVQFLRDQGGRGVVWECKECRSDPFPLGNISVAEQKILDLAASSGALTFLVIAFYLSPAQVLYYGAKWPEWRAVEQALGYVRDRPRPLSTKERWQRRAPGTASVSLIDGRRPACVVQIPTYFTAGGRELLDLSLFLKPVKGIQNASQA